MGLGSGVDDRELTGTKVKEGVKIVDARFEVGVQRFAIDMLHR